MLVPNPVVGACDGCPNEPCVTPPNPGTDPKLVVFGCPNAGIGDAGSALPNGLCGAFREDVKGETGCCCCPKNEPVPASVVLVVKVAMGPTCLPFLPLP